MKNRIGYLLPMAALGFVISCASTPAKTPQPEAAPPEPAPAAQPAAPAVADPEAELNRARSLQKEIDDYSLSTYDPDTYAGGVKDLQAGQDTYGKDNASSKASLTSAIAAFNAVIAKGGPIFLADTMAKTDESKKAADDLKASVAVKEDYAKALAVYQAAVKEKDAGDLESASKDFTAARAQFDAVTATAQQKKDAAMATIQAAQADATASEQNAADALKALQDEGFTPSSSGQ